MTVAAAVAVVAASRWPGSPSVPACVALAPVGGFSGYAASPRSPYSREHTGTSLERPTGRWYSRSPTMRCLVVSANVQHGDEDGDVNDDGDDKGST